MPDVLTPKAAAKRFLDYGKRREKVQRAAMLIVARNAQKSAGQLFVGGGIGRSIWLMKNIDQPAKRKKSNLGKFIRIRMKQEPGKLTLTLSEKGIPALVEQGGRLKPHRIPKARAETGLFAFYAGGQRIVRRGPFAHPGGPAVGRKHLAPQGPYMEREARVQIDRANQVLADAVIR